MRPSVLLLNIGDSKRGTIRLIAMRMGIQCVVVPEEKFGLPLEAVLAGAEAPESAEGGAIPEEMAVLCDFPNPLFTKFLDELRRKKAGIALKAVLTDTNRIWSARELYTELCREREAFAAGTKAHSK